MPKKGVPIAAGQARLSVALLGRFRIALADGESLRVPGARERALLAVLALSPNLQQNRRKLGEMLWDHVRDDTVLDNLRTCLWSLRKVLPVKNAVLSDDDYVALDKTAFDIDVWQLQELSAQNTRIALERAAELSLGDFLEGFDLSTEAFETWLRSERTRLRTLVSDTLGRLAVLQWKDGDSNRGAATAQRVLQLDPLDEHAVATLMQIHARSGRRRAALQLFQSHKERLHSELGAEPEPATRHLYESIVSGKLTPEKSAVSASEPPAIAVLSLAARGDAQAKDFAEALSEWLTATLSLVSDMIVISRSSVIAQENLAANPRDLARALGCRYLVEGSISIRANRVNVLAGLIDTAESDRYLPLAQSEKPLGDFFALQKDITLKAVSALRVRLTEGEQDAINLAHGTGNLDAWILAAQAQKFLRQFTQDANARARQLYEQALSHDERYPAALDGVAWTHLIDARFGWSASHEDSLSRASELVQKALKYDSKRARVYSLLGALSLFAGNHIEAVSFGEQAIAAEPNDPDVAALFAVTLTYSGEPERAIGLVERAIRLRPAPPHWYRWLHARAYRVAGQFRKSADILQSADTPAFASPVPLAELVISFGQLGDEANARVAAAQLMAIDPRFSVGAWLAAPSYADKNEAAREAVILRSAGLSE